MLAEMGDAVNDVEVSEHTDRDGSWRQLEQAGKSIKCRGVL
jgi:hypothetical protein